MGHTDVTVVNGWNLYAHPVLIQHMEALFEEVERLEASDPNGFQHHPAYKLLDCVQRVMFEHVPANPDQPEFRLGKTLGRNRGHWRRVKRLMPNRYRLFFQFRSDAPKCIIFAWLNDERSLREQGARSDVYATFSRLLDGGRIPCRYEDLLAASSRVPVEMSERSA